MSLKTDVILFDTMTRSLREIFAEDGLRLRFYCCGPTVYGPAHIGNFRTFLVQDVFRRLLELNGICCLHVRNITDVDDKTIAHSQVAGLPLAEFTHRWTERFHQDADSLGLLPPHVEPKATEHISQQIDIISKLEKNGLAYQASDRSVYFRIHAWKPYGALSRLSERSLQPQDGSGSVAEDEYEKETAGDFALWKARKPEDGEAYWDSPWGPGRPGWHLECSSMAKEYLGETVDVHSGGVDLIFPHHENEIAQSEGAFNCCFSRHWFHIAHLMVDGGKMSKSLGNLYTLEDICSRGYNPQTLRYALLSGHYRKPLNFTFHSLKAAAQACGRIDSAARSALEALDIKSAPTYESLVKQSDQPSGVFHGALSALTDDLNLPEALGQFFSSLKQIDNFSKASSENLQENAAGFWRFLAAIGHRESAVNRQAAPPSVVALAEERWKAKSAKDFAEADRLRNELSAKGWTVKDGKDGYTLLSSN